MYATGLLMLSCLGILGYTIYTYFVGRQHSGTSAAIASNGLALSVSDDKAAEDAGRAAELLVNLICLAVNVYVLLLLYFKTMDIDSRWKYLLFAFASLPVLVLFFIVYTLHYNPTLVNASVTVFTASILAIMLGTFLFILQAKEVTVKPGAFAASLKSVKPGNKILLTA